MSIYTKTLAGAVGAGFMALGLVTSAQADGYSAPRVGYERPFSWTGLYIGANAGWSNSSIDWVYHDQSGLVADRLLCGGLGCAIKQTEGIYGVHVGYQHQMGALVLGLEAALSFPNGGESSQPCFVAAVTCHAKTDYIATLGPRLGFAFTNWMVYGTAGMAFGQITTGEIGFPLNGAKGGEYGWFAGAGLEYAVTRNVILGVEYQHVRFEDSLQRSGNPVGLIAGPFTEDRNISADYDIVRARLSFKFNNEERARPLK